jgi:endonuclease/exonuclease/phosphatase family metal-dependent hydrolase
MALKIKAMTYNVHSCIGRNGKASISRIAEVIATYNPDLIALQELDIGLSRSGIMDQTLIIAEYLKMNYHFHPSIKIEKGQYGNAALSKYPLCLIKTGQLPTLPDKKKIEKRGAIWTEIEIADYKIQFINTHLGLNRKERLAQIDTLLGREWLKHPSCHPPIIFCGDLNALPGSPVYKKIQEILSDTQRSVIIKRPKKTWPSRFPFRRIDYIFVSRDIIVNKVFVPRTSQVRNASDHLPLIVELYINFDRDSLEANT